MEIREVKIEEYWPLIVKNTVEFGQIAAAENPEFNRLAKCIYQVLQESFVHDATEYGVKRWESILGINPASGATLDDRKATILTYLSVKVPYTWRVLKQMLVPILGGEDKFVMEYFNDEYKLVVHTDRLNDTMLATVSDLLARVLPQNIEVERYNHHIEVSWRDIHKYVHATKTQDLYDMNPDYKSDLTSDGEWVYPLPEMVNFGRRPGGNSATAGFANSNVKKLVAHFPKAIKLSELCRSCKQLKILKINAPLATSVDCIIASAYEVEEMELICPESTGKMFLGADCFTWNTPKLKKVKCVMPKVTEIDMHYNNGALTEFDAEFPSLKDSPNFCPLGILNKASVTKILNSLPTWTDGGTHRILIGIHVDHQTDDEVLVAIANAEAKGWTMTVQWNGTPTSGISTTDLEEIYAKVTESEHGEYTDESGNRCVLDWGHYVTDTSEYKLFFSLVEAEQYFKLTKIEVTENE